MQVGSATVGVLVASLVLRAVGQSSEAVCRSDPTYAWTFNSLQQSPCLVAAYAEGACAPDGDWSIPAIPNSTQTYAGPNASQATLCTCSSVVFNLLSTCAYCQGDGVPVWTGWITNCPASMVSNGQFPVSIPDGTAIPAWAYQQVISKFNFTIAQSVAASGLPESTAPASSPTSSVSSLASMTTSKSITTLLPGPTNTSGNSSSAHVSNLGTIVGGAVGGSVGAILVIAGICILYRYRRNDAIPDAPTTFNSEMAHAQLPSAPNTPNFQAPNTESLKSPGTPPFEAGRTSPFHPENSPMRLYDPDDPSTFPDAVPPAAGPDQGQWRSSSEFQPVYPNVAQL